MNKINSSVTIITILLETLLIAVMNLKIFIATDMSHLKSFLPFLNLMIVLLGGFVVFALKQTDENAKKQVEASTLKLHLNNIENLANVLRTRDHENQRHIQTVQCMLYLDEIEEAKKYIDGVADNYPTISYMDYAGNTLLSVLINCKKAVAEAVNIQFAYAIKCNIRNIGVEAWDLCSILGNLLDNAMEAACQDQQVRRVTMEIRYEGGTYIISVHNSGPTIPPKQLKSLFEPGFTTKGSSARGYGLYIVKKLTDNYNGKIAVINEPLTTFIVYLPEKGADLPHDKRYFNQTSGYDISVAR